MTGHTPGPWKIAPHYLSILGDPKTPGYDDQVMIADCEPSDACTAPSDQQEANARLIAAAPDLLAALKEFLRIAEGKSDEWRARHSISEVKAYQAAADAIAKAEGKTDD